MYLEKFKRVKAFVFDVDGVFTDGSILITESGDQLRSMDIKDGYAVNHAIKAGYEIIVISGGSSEGVRIRLNKLGVRHVELGVKDKMEVLKRLLLELNLRAEDCLAIGDDVPDIQILNYVGCSACPADAIYEIRDIVDYLSPFSGGKGCVRDVIEQVLRLSNRW